MAIRTIRHEGDPLLRKTSKEVKEITPRTRELIQDMFETMDAAEGVGLAAPQVGILRRIVVIDDMDGRRFALINPEMSEFEGAETMQEGCLSVPEMAGPVTRATSLKLRYQDENGDVHEEKVEGFLARIVQHELDHLDGVLYVDRVEDKTMIKRVQGEEEG